MASTNAHITFTHLDYIPDENAVFENIAAYFTANSATNLTKDIQFQRLEEFKEITIKLTEADRLIYQNDVNNKHYNYCKIYINNGSIPFYFYITNVRYNTLDSVVYELKFDKLTTFYSITDFSSSCKIEREHRDRWILNTEDNKYYRIIDPVDEGFQIESRRLLLNSILSVSSPAYKNINWYMIYYTDALSDNSPVRTLLVPEDTLTLTCRLNTSTGDINIIQTLLYIVKASDHDGDTLTFNGTTYTMSLGTFHDVEYLIYYYNGNYRLFKNEITDTGSSLETRSYYLDQSSNANTFKFTTNNSKVYYIAEAPAPDAIFGDGSFAAHRYLTKQYYNSSIAATISTTIQAFSNIAKTDPHFIKIIKCPYIPIDTSYATGTFITHISNDYNSFDAIEVKDDASILNGLIGQFDISYTEVMPVSFYNQTRAIKYESKFYNSSFKQTVISYSNYDLIFKPELYNVTLGDTRLKISYKQAKLRSDLYFKLSKYEYVYDSDEQDYTEYSLSLKSGYSLENPYVDYLISDINNEIPIYTSEYINYIKTGYNYDKASINRQAAVSTATTGVSLALGLASLAASGLTGGVSAAAGIAFIGSGITSSINTINTIVSNEANLAKKITSYQNTATGITGVNAVDLRESYGSFKAYHREYGLSPELEAELANLWHKYGYKTDRIGVPNTSNRIYFNFVQLSECYFDNIYKFNAYTDYANDLKELYKEGVFIYHLVSNNYDTLKQYENFETSLL